MILLIDNYDSFSYNLYQLIGELEPDVKIIRNDDMTVAEIKELNPDHIILSPGPGRPEDAGIIIDVAKNIHDTPILGVCLGHQAVCAAFGATITYAKPANKKSSMRDVKIYGYGKTREKYNKKAVRKGRPKGRRSTVIPPRQGQAASPCLRASLTLRAASAIGQPRG